MIATYEESVFINCPFDSDYEPLLNAIVFTVFRCGFVPRSAMEEDDSSNSRLDKIVRLIRLCKYGIHDISRTQLDRGTNLPRFNMPFELGLFWGAKLNGNKEQQTKVAVIFETEKYVYQKYLSDINGVDIKAHGNDVKVIVRHIRNWLFTNTGNSKIPSFVRIFKDYEEFLEIRLPIILRESHSFIGDLTFNDYCTMVSNYLLRK